MREEIGMTIGLTIEGGTAVTIAMGTIGTEGTNLPTKTMRHLDLEGDVMIKN